MNMKSLFSIANIICIIVFLFANITNAQTEEKSRSFVAKDLIDINTLPKWFSESMVREKTIKKKSKLKLKELNVSSKVVGKIKLVEKGENFWSYHIDIGTDSPVECYVFSAFDGPANSLFAIVDAVLKEGVPNLYQKPLSNKFNYAIGSGVFDGTPYLLMDTLFVVGEGEEKTSGVLKAFSAETNNSLQVCMHNEVGYRETFFSVFQSFVGAFTANEKSSAFFETVVQMIINDIPVGYSREMYTVDGEGDIQVVNESSLLVPVGASSASRTDTKSTSWSRLDGSLINGSEYSVNNSVLSSSISIDPQDEKWQVVGQVQGKEVKYELDYDGWLLSGYGFYVGVADLEKSDQNSAKYYMWLPDADPSSALEVTISKVLNNPNANFKLNLGPVVMDILAEENGVFRKGVLEQGPVAVDFETIYLKGEPSL